MSDNDENLYRGDPPSPSPPPGYPPLPSPPPQTVAAGYGPPGYGPPGYPTTYGRPTNTVAILALAMTFVFAPAGLVLGIVARRQVRRTGEDGDGLALAAIIIGGVLTAVVVFFIVLWIIVFAALSSTGFGP